ncbi:SDR family NAD(P)-dependent oxidoreductase [Marine Group I thaumarchaeote]|uniref:SDR family NAD(P)-dependent oxidoreductase n=1 Tax=Marine Group I thaumarchaeote TaxID=2511932 RepID=A0A7K4MMS8_9ARCH|nr:SDR family NAD(P)-dependent oxidoreductase [Marine Group I thaumarchaeote]
MTLDGKTCFLTGASGGLGKEIAKEIASYNCNLFLTGRDEEKLIKLKETIKNSINDKIKVNYQTGDLNNLNDIKNIITSARNSFNRFDILINSAGIFLSKSIQNNTWEEFEKLFNVNIRATFIFCKEFSNDMTKNEWGRIVNIGSTSSYSGFKNGSIYCSSKHAVLGLSRTLQNELKSKNVRTFCISPGSIKTEMGKTSKDQDFETFLNPKEVSKYLVFAISFDSELVSEEIRLNRMNVK